MLVAGRYTVEAVQSQVIQQGPAGQEIWLAVGLRRGKGGENVIGWMQSSELQRRTAGDVVWLARLRGKVREGWSAEGHNWECSGSPSATGHGTRRAVVGWYLPVLVVDEEQTKKVGGVRLKVLMKKVALGRIAGGFEQTVAIRCRQGYS